MPIRDYILVIKHKTQLMQCLINDKLDTLVRFNNVASIFNKRWINTSVYVFLLKKDIFCRICSIHWSIEVFIIWEYNRYKY